MNWAPKAAGPPAGYRYGPAYRPSWLNIARAITYILRGKPRSLAHDALFALADAPHPPLLRGIDHIPERAPFVVVANHYERPGLWMAWPAMILAHTVRDRTAQDTHWVAIEEWQSFSLFGIDVPRPVIRAVFERAFHTYGILAMAPEDAPAAARAASMRAVARVVREGRIVGVMPEGTVGETPELLPAREGAGAFLLLLTGGRIPVVPVGLFEENERLVLNAGAPIDLRPPGDVPRDQRDAWARRRVMLAIRELTPKVLWGQMRDMEA